QRPYSDILVHWLYRTDRCEGIFAHSPKIANFIFYDGHVKPKRWLDTLYPTNKNNWQLDEPNPNPNNLRIAPIAGCQEPVPTSPNSPENRQPPCDQYH